MRCLLGAIFVAMALVFPASPAFAQAGRLARPAAPIGQVLVGARQVVPENQIDSWVFRQDRTPVAARQRQDNLLELKVDELDRVCRLTAEQKKKLLLMGQGDIKRFFDRYEAYKERVSQLQNVNQDLSAVYTDSTPLAAALQTGLFQTGSLFCKALPNTISHNQLAAYEATVRERLKSRHGANILLIVTTLEEAVPLPDAQRKKVIAFLNESVKPAHITGPYDFYYLMWQLSEIPDEKLKTLFDATQWRAVAIFVNQYKGMEPTLRQFGYLQNPAEDEERP